MAGKSSSGPAPDEPELEGRVVCAQSGFYTVETGSGSMKAVLRGLLRRERREEGLAALGDMVRLRPIPPSEAGDGQVDAVISEVLPRRSTLARRAPGPKGVWGKDVIVANLDLMVAVFAVRDPEPKWRMLDRFLALAEIDEIDATIVLSKVDLGVSAAVQRAVDVYRAIGYSVIAVSTVTSEGVTELRAQLAGRVSAVVGPSGVGKSSLLNAVAPGLGLAVGEVSTAVHKGRHTTRVGELHPLPGGGWVADTPGLREIGLWDVDPGELEWAFVEFRPYLNNCRFYDCTHVHEPGCQVQAAVVTGEINAERHASYVGLLAKEG